MFSPTHVVAAALLMTRAEQNINHDALHIMEILICATVYCCFVILLLKVQL